MADKHSHPIIVFFICILLIGIITGLIFVSENRSKIKTLEIQFKELEDDGTGICYRAEKEFIFETTLYPYETTDALKFIFDNEINKNLCYKEWEIAIEGIEMEVLTSTKRYSLKNKLYLENKEHINKLKVRVIIRGLWITK
jgi:hypothetical protein